MESNDSPEIPDRGETSNIPGLPLGEEYYGSDPQHLKHTTGQTLNITRTLLVRHSRSQAHYWSDPKHHKHTTGQTLNITSILLVRPSTSQEHYWSDPQHHKNTTGQTINITRTLLVRPSTSQASDCSQPVTIVGLLTSCTAYAMHTDIPRQNCESHTSILSSICQHTLPYFKGQHIPFPTVLEWWSSWSCVH